MSLTELAGRLGVHKSMLSHIERWRTAPSLALAARLEEITGVPARCLVRRES